MECRQDKREVDEMKLLIVDDEPLTVDMLAIFLEINGHECHKAYNGTDGLAILELEKPDALVLDLMMPDMMGFDFCQQMRAKEAFARTPVVILSARTDTEAIERAYQVGANAYLTKPPDLGSLLAKLEELHREHLST